MLHFFYHFFNKIVSYDVKCVIVVIDRNFIHSFIQVSAERYLSTLSSVVTINT